MEDKLNDKWINIEEAAEYLGVKDGYVMIKEYQHTKSGSNGSLNVLNLMCGLKVEKVLSSN